MTEQPPLTQLPQPTARWIDGQLRCSRHDDIYFSAQDGLAESRHVFLKGTEFAERLNSSQHLVIAETGFGSGLNLCAVMSHIRDTNSRCIIDYISIEGNPLPSDLARNALASFKDIQEQADQLLSCWPPRWPGIHHLSLMNDQVRLQLHYAQAEDVLPQLDFKADIWFLDGFSPSRNPDFWSETVLSNIGRLSGEGTNLASFSVASQIRAGLSQAGFICERIPGFGHKRHMLKARMGRGKPKSKNKAVPQKIAIIGGGIAGCAMSYHLRHLDIDHVIIDASNGLATGASGNPAGLISPHLSAGDSPSAQLAMSAFADCLAPAQASGSVISEGCFSLDIPQAAKDRHHKISRHGYPSDFLHYLTKTEISEVARCELPTGGLMLPHACVISPRHFCEWLSEGSPQVLNFTLADVTRNTDEFQIKSKEGDVIKADHLVLCAGHALPHLLSLLERPVAEFQVTSGQISLAPKSPQRSLPEGAINYGGYLLGLNDKVLLGASYDVSASAEVSDRAHQHNLDLLPEYLHPLVETNFEEWSGRTSFRLATRYRMPLCGALDGNIDILGALGSRGLTHSFFLSRHIAMKVAGRPDFLYRSWRDAMRVERVFGVNF